MADIITLAIIGAMALWGYKTGLVRAVFHFGYYIISLLAASLLYPVLSSWLSDSRLAVYIHDEIVLPRVSVNTQGLAALPGFMQKAVETGVQSTTEALAASATTMLLNLICFIGVFLIVRFGLRLLVQVLNTIAKLPVISVFNKAGGLIVGTVNGVLTVYLLLAVASMFISNAIYEFLSGSVFTMQMYNDNLLLRLIFG